MFIRCPLVCYRFAHGASLSGRCLLLFGVWISFVASLHPHAIPTPLVWSCVCREPVTSGHAVEESGGDDAVDPLSALAADADPLSAGDSEVTAATSAASDGFGQYDVDTPVRLVKQRAIAKCECSGTRMIAAAGVLALEDVAARLVPARVLCVLALQGFTRVPGCACRAPAWVQGPSICRCAVLHGLQMADKPMDDSFEPWGMKRPVYIPPRSCVLTVYAGCRRLHVWHLAC